MNACADASQEKPANLWPDMLIKRTF